MTACALKSNGTKATWNTTFPTKCDSDVKSLIFMKKLLAIAISNITYLRAIFPEHSYGNRQIEDLKLKILSEDDDDHEGVAQVVQWVQGCFHALERKYLRQMMLGIYIDENNPDNVVESYSFRFSYDRDGSTSVTCNEENLCSTTTQTDESIRRSTLSLLRTCIVLTNNLNPLPEKAFMTMKLLYFDDITPADYEPPGFISSDTDTFFFKDKPVNIKIGEVKTDYHTLKMRAKTSSPEFTGKMDSSDSHSSGPNLEDGVPVVPIQNDNEEPMLNESPQNDSVEDDEEPNVKCPCKDCDNDDGMIQCSICHAWQHMFCFGLVEDLPALQNHVCSNCANDNYPHLQPTDTLLHQLPEGKRRLLSLFRRSLQMCLENKFLTLKDLRIRLSIDNVMAKTIMKRLEVEGYISSGTGSQKGRKRANHDFVRSNGFSYYFKKRSEVKDGSLIIDSPESQVIHELNVSTSRMSVNDEIPGSQGRKRSAQTVDISLDSSLAPTTAKRGKVSKPSKNLEV